MNSIDELREALEEIAREIKGPERWRYRRLQQALTELSGLREKVKKMERVLKEVEWEGTGGDKMGYCPACQNHKMQGHDEICLAKQALKGE